MGFCSVDRKIQSAERLNSHLYTAPNVVERLQNKESLSVDEYKGKAAQSIAKFEEAFRKEQ